MKHSGKNPDLLIRVNWINVFEKVNDWFNEILEQLKLKKEVNIDLSLKKLSRLKNELLQFEEIIRRSCSQDKLKLIEKLPNLTILIEDYNVLSRIQFTAK